MRREVIFILLGIIFVSTLSSFLAGYAQADPEKILLDTVVGAVGAGNFSYWQLGHSGPLLVELNSVTGDADLYVADNISPSFETDRNNYSSVTCGTDLIHIPATFPRPIGIGVFGYWSHHLSEYNIQVFLDTSAFPGQMAHQYRGPEKFDPKKQDSETIPKKEKKQPVVMKFLNVIDTILDMSNGLDNHSFGKVIVTKPGTSLDPRFEYLIHELDFEEGPLFKIKLV